MQCHPHDAVLVIAHSFVSIGVEARCRPCHSAAHCRHMKRQPSLCHCCPCRGHSHCDCHRRCCCCRHCRLHCHCRPCCHRCCCCRHPSLLPLLSPIAVALVIGHCCLRHCQPSHLPSLLAITIAVAIGHFQELLPWHSENFIQTIQTKNAYLILFCSDRGQRTDQSQITDQALSGNDQHQRRTTSSKQQAASEGSGW